MYLLLQIIHIFTKSTATIAMQIISTPVSTILVNQMSSGDITSWRNIGQVPVTEICHHGKIWHWECAAMKNLAKGQVLLLHAMTGNTWCVIEHWIWNF